MWDSSISGSFEESDLLFIAHGGGEARYLTVQYMGQSVTAVHFADRCPAQSAFWHAGEQ